MNRRPQRRRELEASGGQCQQLSPSSGTKLCKNTTGFKKIRFPDRIIMTVLFLSYGFWPNHPGFARLFISRGAEFFAGSSPALRLRSGGVLCGQLSGPSLTLRGSSLRAALRPFAYAQGEFFAGSSPALRLRSGRSSLKTVRRTVLSAAPRRGGPLLTPSFPGRPGACRGPGARLEFPRSVRPAICPGRNGNP
jgi:hypothetical protein